MLGPVQLAKALRGLDRRPEIQAFSLACLISITVSSASMS